jgi:broad specificity phosphatase PhoE
MKISAAAILITVFLCSCGNAKKPSTDLDQTTTYYFIRHSEKDRANSTDRNPNLNEMGQQRAASWATYFDSIDLDMVYATDYNRTQQTATPTAESKNLAIMSYDPSAMYDEGFKAATQGKTVLVVGHSNTTPAFVNMVLGARTYEDIDDNENGMLYIVKVTNEGATATEKKIGN